MLTIEDCIGLSELSEEEVLAIAQHEHIPQIAAIELGNYLVQTPAGEERIKAMILDDIEEARRQQDRERLLTLKLCLKRFLEHHLRTHSVSHGDDSRASPGVALVPKRCKR
jgi:hypothetical protein